MNEERMIEIERAMVEAVGSVEEFGLKFISTKMALSLQMVSKIDKERRLTVSGYIREYEEVNQVSIPSEIILVLVLFYGNDTDEWDPKLISKCMELKSKTLTQIAVGYRSSYGKRIIDSGIFKWILKINQWENNGFMLGLRTVKSNDDIPPTNTWFTECGYKNGYGFRIRPSLTSLTGPEGYAGGKEYGVEPQNGAIIEMILDLDNLTLSYIIDGVDYGKAFDVTEGKFRLALFLHKVGDSLTLL